MVPCFKRHLDKPANSSLNHYMSIDRATQSPTLDPVEIARFGAMADEWWDPTGKFRPLHKIGPARLQFFRDEICRHFGKDTAQPRALEGLTLVDIGCGGGLIAEPMAKQGATVTGVDPSEDNIKAASLHAKRQNVDIDYRSCRAEDVVEAKETYDIVFCLEVVEHVPSVPDFIALITKLVAPGGLLVLSTINRTPKAFALAIVGAEYVLKWLPKGTHQWNRFITPDELMECVSDAGLSPRETSGLVYSPFKDSWSISSDCDVNYFLTSSRDK